MTLAHPYFLLLLPLLPVLAWLKGKRGQPPAFVYSSVQLMSGIFRASKSRSGAFLGALRWLAVALFIVALAQPRLTHSETQIKASGIDIAVVFDMSYSMAAEDFEIGRQVLDRFKMAREVLKKFIENRPNDRIGLIVFATQAFVASPLTLDHDFLLEHLSRLHLGSIDGGSTAIGSGLSTGINRLRELQSKSKIIILMTDGRNNSGKIPPETAAEAAQALGVKIYTIGVGKHGNSQAPAFDPNTGDYILDPWGRKNYRVVEEDLNEDELQKIAQMTGGKFYRADNAEKFQTIYSEIDKLEKSEATVKKFSHHREFYAQVIAAGLALLLLELAMGQTILRRLP